MTRVNADPAAAYTKQGLGHLIDKLPSCSATVVEECVSFFVAETRGHWHNRARAKIARRLKHCAIDDAAANHIVDVIARRLVEGRFSEQFKDQLRLMLLLDRQAASEASGIAAQSRIAHVRRYGKWLAERLSEDG